MKYLSILIFWILTVTHVLAEFCPEQSDPGSGLKGYLKAMQGHRFEDAYKFVTRNMTDGKSMENWAALQRHFYLGGEVTIFGISIRRGIANEGDADCLRGALVPNVLRSRDKFNNQGTTEFELYSMIKDGNVWKVDSLEVLFDDAEIYKWFPNDRVPEFRDQHPSKNY